MATLTLPKSIQKILVVGPIYDKISKLKEIERMLPDFDWIIFNDGITYYVNDLVQIIKRMDAMDELIYSSQKVIYNAGGMDLDLASRMDIFQPDQLKIEQWIQRHPNIVVADFNQAFKAIIVSGGIPANISNLDQLDYNTDIVLTHPHESYTGGLGYVICNKPLTNSVPKFHRFSVQIGNTPDGHVYGLKIDRNGVQRTILI